MKGLIVTGTDTGVGKTIVSASVLGLLRGRRRLYWKLAQTGFPEDDDTALVKRLADLAQDEVREPMTRLAMPASPHEAALAEGIRVEIRDSDLAMPSDRVAIIEGSGGLLVPLSERVLLADLFARLALPLLIVARPDVGTINHTLLTLAEARRRELPIAALVFSRPPTAAVRDVVGKLGGIDPIVLPYLGEPPTLRYDIPGLRRLVESLVP